MNIKEKSPGFFASVIVYAVEWGGRSGHWGRWWSCNRKLLWKTWVGRSCRKPNCGKQFKRSKRSELSYSADVRNGCDVSPSNNIAHCNTACLSGISFCNKLSAVVEQWSLAAHNTSRRSMHLHGTFPTQNGLYIGNDLFPLQFNLAILCTTVKVQNTKRNWNWMEQSFRSAMAGSTYWAETQKLQTKPFKPYWLCTAPFTYSTTVRSVHTVFICFVFIW